MKSARWDRADVITEVRRDIWRHLTAAAKTDEDLVLDAASLLQMPSVEVRALAQVQFILSSQVDKLLAQMPVLIRVLTTTTEQELEVSSERIRGAIRWSETFGARAVSGMPHIFVTAPARRAFSTPENELLKFVLNAIADFGKRTGWHRSTSANAGDEVRRRVAAAVRWTHTQTLGEVPARVPTSTSVSRVRGGRARRPFQPALDVYALYSRFVARLDRGAIRAAVEHHALVTSRDSVLLELLCAFKIIAGLRALGWRTGAPGLLRPPLLLRAAKGSAILSLYYQHAPRRLGTPSVYREVQRAHEFASVGGLIPDFVLHLECPGIARWFLVEVKGVERAVEDSARAAARDLLAYRRAFRSSLRNQAGPYAIGVGWGRELEPSRDEEIVLCSPDTLVEALDLVLSHA